MKSGTIFSFKSTCLTFDQDKWIMWKSKWIAVIVIMFENRDNWNSRKILTDFNLQWMTKNYTN